METNNSARPQTENISCNICGHSNTKFLYAKYNLEIVKCRHCNLVFTNPRLQEEDLLKRYSPEYFFNEYLPGLDASEKTYNHEFVRKHFSLITDLAGKYFSPGRKLLDVGCGAGFFLKVAEERGWKAEGVDLLDLAAEYGKNVLGVNVKQGKFENIQYPSESFDVVTLLDTIEHMPDPYQTVIEIKRILKINGILIVSTPDLNSLSRLFLGKDWAVLSPAEHLFYFTEKTLRDIITKADFQILGIRNLLHFDPEYTHNKKTRRYFLWKDYYDRFERRRILKRIRQYEFLDIMSVEGETDISLPPWKFSKFKSNIYKIARIWLKGDTLVAIAKKE